MTPIVRCESILHVTFLSVGYYYFHRIIHAYCWRCVVIDCLTSINTLCTMKVASLMLLCVGCLLVVVPLSRATPDWSPDSDYYYPGHGPGGWTPQRWFLLHYYIFL